MGRRVDDQSRQQFADGMEPVFEGRDDPEIPASAADSPEEIRVLSVLVRVPR